MKLVISKKRMTHNINVSINERYELDSSCILGVKMSSR